VLVRRLPPLPVGGHGLVGLRSRPLRGAIAPPRQGRPAGWVFGKKTQQKE
jgi:hypothetical protein